MSYEEDGQKSFNKNKLQSVIQCLIAIDILLPIGMVFLFVFGRFFSFFGDAISASVIDVIALIFGFFWFVLLVALLFCVALTTLEIKNETIFPNEKSDNT